MNKSLIWMFICLIMAFSVSGFDLDNTSTGDRFYWSLDDADLVHSVDAGDLTTNHISGDNSGAVTNATGHINEAFTDFNVTVQGLTIQNASFNSAFGSVSHTFNTWFKVGVVRGRTFLFYGFGGNGLSYDLEVGGEIRVQAQCTGRAYVTANGLAGPYNDGNFHMLTVILNLEDDEVEVWADGVRDFNLSITGATDCSKAAEKVGVGWRSEETDEPFWGTLDETGFWNYKLTNEQIASLYNAGTGFNPFAPAPPAPVTAILDIIFRNSTGDTKTIFDEHERIDVFLNHSLATGVELDSTCNISAEKGLSEIRDTNVPFNICGTGCDDVTRWNTADFTGASLTGIGGLNDTLHLSICHEQIQVGDVNISMSCEAGTTTQILSGVEIPTCLIGTANVDVTSPLCVNNATVNFSVSFDGANNRRKNVTEFNMHREFEVLKYTANNFTDGLNHDSSSLEYLKHGTQTINASCFFNSTISNVTSETITIVNAPPEVIHDVFFVGTTVYNLTNGTVAEYEAENFTFNLIINDDDLLSANHTLYCNNASGVVLWFDLQSLDDTHIVFHSNFTDFACNPFILTTRALDTANNFTELSTNFNVTDTNAPNQVGIINRSITINTTYTFEVTFTDDNFFGYNYTCDNGQSASETGLNVQSHTVNISLDINSSLVTCLWTYCDGHTNAVLNKYWEVINTSKNFYFRIDNTLQKRLFFDMDNISLKYKIKEDRVSFTVENLAEEKNREWLVYYYCDEGCYYIRDDKYKAWIVDWPNGLWLDLNGVKGDVSVFKNNGTFEIRFSSDQKKILFDSIGELNCVQLSQGITGRLAELDLLGWLELDTCKMDTLVEIFTTVSLFLFLLAVYLLNNLVIIKFMRLGILDTFVGLAFFFYGLHIWGCSVIVGWSVMAMGVFIFFLAFTDVFEKLG